MEKPKQIYHLSEELHNFCKTFERDLTVPRAGRVKEMIHGIIRGKKGILSEIARQNRRKKGVIPICNRNHTGVE